MSDASLYNMDCMEFVKTLAEGTIDAVVTDPPYGTNDGKGKVMGDAKAHGELVVCLRLMK